MKTPTKTPNKPAPAPHTRAWATFEENLDGVGHFIAVAQRDADLLMREAKRFSVALEKEKRGIAVDKAMRIVRKADRYFETFGAGVARLKTVTLWKLVLLVTCVEAYLQDVLVGAASVDKEIMGGSEQCAVYDDVITATSLDDLANGLRVRWARGWLSDGGPKRWLKRLELLGARGYPSDLADRLELWWGVRHVVVHSAGVTTEDFVKRHPGVVKKPGERLLASSHDVKAFLGAMTAFMEPTEAFFLKRCPALVHTPLPSAPRRPFSEIVNDLKASIVVETPTGQRAGNVRAEKAIREKAVSPVE